MNNLMPPLLQSNATGKLLHTGDINTVDAGAIIRQKRSKWPPHHLRPVDDADSVPEQPVSIGQNGVVDVEVLQNLDVGQRGAGQDALLTLGLRVQEPDVLIHVEDVAVAQTLDVLADVHDLLQVLVLSVVEDRVVDDNAIDVGVGVGGDEGIFDIVAGNFTEGILEATLQNVSQ
jgi:hypothetical protein